jgi:hypothetical protein
VSLATLLHPLRARSASLNKDRAISRHWQELSKLANEEIKVAAKRALSTPNIVEIFALTAWIAERVLRLRRGKARRWQRYPPSSGTHASVVRMRAPRYASAHCERLSRYYPP